MINIESKTYENEEEFIQDMYFKWYPEDTSKAKRKIKHEQNHFNKAIGLNYHPQYCFKRTKINLGLFVLTINKPYIKLKEKVIQKQHFKEICLVPEYPSFSDKFYASKSFQVFYGFCEKYNKIKKKFKK